MKKTHFNETTQRHGYLTGDIHYHDAGISSKTGNRYNAFAYFYYLPLNREQTVRIDVDVAFYDENRSRLYEGLTKLGFTCIKPEGAFYLWVKSPVENEEEFVNEGKKFNLLMVKGSAFGCPGFVRLAYCVSHETVEHSLPAFAKLAAVYGLDK